MSSDANVHLHSAHRPCCASYQTQGPFAAGLRIAEDVPAAVDLCVAGVLSLRHYC
jgi:hypothetical protein